MGEQAELDKRARVEEQVDPLARGQLVPGVLLGDPLLATHGERARTPITERGGELVEARCLRAAAHRGTKVRQRRR